MSGAANTTTQIAGSRTAASIRREDHRAFTILGLSPLSHIVIIGLAGLIWWIARGMVAQTVTLENSAVVKFTLAESLRQSWAIVEPQSPATVSIDVSGPSAEVSKFAGLLAANRDAFGYVYVIKPSDIESFRPEGSSFYTFEQDLAEFRETGVESIKPAEVKILAPAPGRMQTIRIEPIVSRTALIEVRNQVMGDVPGFTVNVTVQAGFELEVSGPAGRVREISNAEGLPELRIVKVDVAQLLKTKAQGDGKNREQILQDGFTELLDLVSADGVSVRRKGADAVVSQVPVRFTFDAQLDYAEAPERDIPVSVRMPAWMIERGVRVEGVPRTKKVVMQVLRRQLPDFNEANVSVVLDLSKIKFADLKNIEAPEGDGPGQRKARLNGLYFALDINTEKLTYRFLRADMTASQYVPAEEIRLVWVE